MTTGMSDAAPGRNTSGASGTSGTTSSTGEKASNAAGSARDQAGNVAQSAREQAGSVAQTASQQASSVAQTATEQASSVAQTAGEQVREVTAEAQVQARNLAAEVKDQISEQVDTQRDRLVSTLKSVADELREMSKQSGESGIATQIARQASDRVQDLARYVDGKQPGDVLDTVTGYARRRPGAFLAGAAALGAVAGRVTRGAAAAKSTSSGRSSSQASGTGRSYSGGQTQRPGVEQTRTGDASYPYSDQRGAGTTGDLADAESPRPAGSVDLGTDDALSRQTYGTRP